MHKKEVLISAKNISKSYDLGGNIIQALKDTTLEIQQGEFIAIIGKSGSGKSTLMHILGLLDSPSTGQIIFKGKDISNLSENQLAKIRNKEIGFVFQAFNLLQRTSTIDNIILPLKYSKVPRSEWQNRAEEMLDLVGLQSRKYNKSNELSGGQKQRVAIARALINNPSILMADEPTGNLDTKTGEEIVKIFHELNEKGTTIIIVTHDEDLAKIAKRQIIIRDGEIINQ